MPWDGATPSSREVKRRCHTIVASRRLITTLQLLLAFVREATTAAATETELVSTVRLDLPWVRVPVPRRSEAAGLMRSKPEEAYEQLCMALADTDGEDGGMRRIRQLLQRTSRWDT